MTSTTVIIWNNHMYGSHAYPGHASMSIDSAWSASSGSYVSWWPGKTKDSGGKLAKPTLEFFADLKEEGYAPDHIIRIDGLLTDKMQSKWSQKKSKAGAHYKFFAKNCSTLVAGVLMDGGSGGKWWTRNQLVWTPLKVRDLALEMGGTKMSWDALLGEMVNQNYMNNADRVVLANLYKRDAKHGKNSTGNQSYYAKGEKINNKSHLLWAGGKHEIGAKKDGGSFFHAYEGSLLSSGTVYAINGGSQLKSNFTNNRVQL